MSGRRTRQGRNEGSARPPIEQVAHKSSPRPGRIIFPRPGALLRAQPQRHVACWGRRGHGKQDRIFCDAAAAALSEADKNPFGIKEESDRTRTSPPSFARSLIHSDPSACMDRATLGSWPGVPGRTGGRRMMQRARNASCEVERMPEGRLAVDRLRLLPRGRRLGGRYATTRSLSLAITAAN